MSYSMETLEREIQGTRPYVHSSRLLYGANPQSIETLETMETCVHRHIQAQTNAAPTTNATAIYTAQTAIQPSTSCARNISLSITHEQHKALWKVPRYTQKDIHKLRIVQRTLGQIVDQDNQCHYCEGNFTHYTDHYIPHCPVTIRYKQQDNTKKLITLVGKFPIMQ